MIRRKLLHFTQKHSILDHVVRVFIGVTFHKFAIEAAFGFDLVVETGTRAILVLT